MYQEEPVTYFVKWSHVKLPILL